MLHIIEKTLEVFLGAVEIAILICGLFFVCGIISAPFFFLGGVS